MKASEKVDWCLISFIFGCFMILYGSYYIQQKQVEVEQPTVGQVIREIDIATECKKSVDCRYLAEVGYHEARGESDLGVAAVMSVVLNRKNTMGRWPNDVKSVVYDRCQFSYTCQTKIKKLKDFVQRERMYNLAWKVLQNGPLEYLKGATHYHTAKVNPFWSKKLKVITRIDNHIFYREE